MSNECTIHLVLANNGTIYFRCGIHCTDETDSLPNESCRNAAKIQFNKIVKLLQ